MPDPRVGVTCLTHSPWQAHTPFERHGLGLRLYGLGFWDLGNRVGHLEAILDAGSKSGVDLGDPLPIMAGLHPF